MPSQVKMVSVTETLRFVRVASPGDLEAERIVFRSQASIDLVTLLIASMEAAGDDGDEYRDLNQDFFWFPSKHVEPEQLVVLHTKRGRNRTYVTDKGTTVHAFYWAKSSPVWQGRTNAVAVLRIRGFDFYNVKQENGQG